MYKLSSFLMTFRIPYYQINFYKFYCSNQAHFGFPRKFSYTEQEKILNTLNKSTADNLLSFNIAQSKIKNLEKYKKRRGLFKSFDELLEVDGLSLRSIEKLCQQLIAASPTENINIIKSANNGNKKIKQLVIPPLSSCSENNISSAIGLHVTPIGISWAKIKKDQNEVEFWGHKVFGSLPKKISPTDTLKLALNILSQIPSGDVYVFDAINGLALSQGQMQTSTAASNNLNLELSSMLLALINTSKEHNVNYECDLTKYDDHANCVYYLKSKLSARLFKTWIGNESVSSTPTIQQLLESSTATHFTLPCTPIKMEHHLKKHYESQASHHKELLGQALMLTIAFMDICIYKNADSIKSILPGKN